MFNNDAQKQQYDARLTEPLERRVEVLERALRAIDSDNGYIESHEGKQAICELCGQPSSLSLTDWPVDHLKDCPKAIARAALASTPREGMEEPYVVVDTSECWEARCWPEDFNHENGQYSNWCVYCKQLFVGHKRRVVCRVCATKTEQPADPPADREQVRRETKALWPLEKRMLRRAAELDLLSDPVGWKIAAELRRLAADGEQK